MWQLSVHVLERTAVYVGYDSVSKKPWLWMLEGVFTIMMKNICFMHVLHARVGDKRDTDKSTEGAGVQVNQRECVYFFEMKVGRDDGMEGGREGREEEGALQSCRLGCISSRNCSLPCGGHLTVLSPSTEGWLCLKVLGPAPAVRHAWCLIHTQGEYWERLRRNAIHRL